MAESFKLYADKNTHRRGAQPQSVSTLITLLLLSLFFVTSTVSGVNAIYLSDDSAEIVELSWVQPLCRYLDCEQWAMPAQSYDGVTIRDAQLIQYGTTLIFNGYISHTSTMNWPQLNLTLYDSGGRDVARYQLQPRDYLSDSNVPQMTIDAQAIRFSVDNMNQATEYSVAFSAPAKS